MDDEEQIEPKIKEYEDFLNHSLKPDLKEIESLLANKSEEVKDWDDVKRTTRLLRLHVQNVDDYLTVYNRLFRMDNYELFVKGQINQINKIFVKIGCNCLLEMDLDEADKYADIRLRALEKEMEHYRKLAVKVKVNIKLTLLAINELDPILNTS